MFLFQVKEMMLWRDNDNNSLLFSAVISNSPEMFNTVMACVDKALSPIQVWHVNFKNLMYFIGTVI